MHGLCRVPWYGTLRLAARRILTLDLMLASVGPLVDVTIYTPELATSSVQFGGTIAKDGIFAQPMFVQSNCA